MKFTTEGCARLVEKAAQLALSVIEEAALSVIEEATQVDSRRIMERVERLSM